MQNDTKVAFTLHNTSVGASLVFKTLALADKSSQWVKVLSSTIFLNWGKRPKYTKECVTLLS